MAQDLLLAVSLDVEEEGLFCGRYKCADLSLRNVAFLERLNPLLERGVRPTLFCAYPVLNDPDCRHILERYQGRAEIGAHLHHWNTPPIAQNIPASGELFAVPANQAPIQALDSKLEHLMACGRDFLGENPTSFRMGRWDLHKNLLPLLVRHGILADASIRPLHSFTSKDKGPDHFNAPSDPYWINLPDGRMLEIPLTVAPLFAPFEHLPGRYNWGRKLRASLRHWGALALLPVKHPLWLMKLTTNMHLNGGGRVLSLTWHSSEMMPGGTPHLPDQFSIDSFLARISAYLDWLEKNFNVKYVTMSGLRQIPGWPSGRTSQGDWAWE